MRFESIRLIHAQGVPNSYIYNQVYVPADEDHQKRGVFIILLHQTNTKDGHFLASLVNTLIREYYRHASVDLLTDFEQALVRLNSQIQSFRVSTEDATPFELHGSVVLFANDEVHLSHIGRPQAYLSRETNLIKLVEDRQPGDAPNDNTFSVLTSGEIRADDILTLITPLTNDDGLADDLTFAVKQVPLFETGRAYARILKQKLERDVEAMFIRFNETEDTGQQIYIDRSLESLSEKFETYQKGLVRHSAFVFDGGKFVVEKSKQLRAKKESTNNLTDLPHNHEERPTSYESVDARNPESFTEPAADEPTFENLEDQNIEDIGLPPPKATPKTDDNDDSNYRVRHYLELNNEDQKPELISSKKSVDAVYDQSTTPKRTLPIINTPAFAKLKFKPRTLYTLIGILVLLGIVVNTVNTVAQKSESPAPAKQTAAERDAIIQKAEATFREGETAQVQDNTTTAIDSFLTVIDTLETINDKNQNEASKALNARAESALKTLVKATELPAGTKPQTTSGTPAHIIATTNGSLIVNNDATLQKYTGDTITSIPNTVKSEISTATAFDEGKKVALYAKDQTVYSVDLTNNEAKQITRTDGQAWPKSNVITSYLTNLYFVGDSMSKATPKDDKYRVTAYNKDTVTTTISSITNNSANATFYAVENDKQVVRIVTNAPKTLIALTGLPERMLPQKITRIMTNPKDGLLYLFEATNQRVLLYNADGVYRKQFTLPTDSKYIDCDLADTNLVCISEAKQVKTFSLQ